ncbi:MAG: tRNA pseudouridine(55) synthase TruB [Thermoanaerobaculales bacterium]
MSRRRPSRFHGLLPVYKQSGPTSHDIVDMARKALGERRIGHTGTLDPMAEGLLLLCVGQATRLQQYLLAWNKTYEGQVWLGHATTTYDGEGERTEPEGSPPILDRETLDRLEARFSGEIQQVPPPYSAKKVSGRKLYELARNGETVEIEPKTVTVHGFSLEANAPNLIAVEVTTSTGFYVRSLAHDIGIELGCGGHLHHLYRTAIGPYAASSALEQGALEAATGPEEILDGPPWIPISEIELPFKEIVLNTGAADRFCHGQEVVMLRQGATNIAKESRVIVRGEGNQMLGIGVVQAVLARGRTLTVAPSLVLDLTSSPS